MEFSEQSFLEELLTLKRDNNGWNTNTIPTDMNQLFSSCNWSNTTTTTTASSGNNTQYDYCFNENPSPTVNFPNSFYDSFSPPFDQHDLSYSTLDEIYRPLFDEFSAPPPQLIATDESPLNTLDTAAFFAQEDIPLSMMEMEDVEEPNLLADDFRNLEMQRNVCKMEPVQMEPSEAPVFNMGSCLERKNRSKKLDGQPSKNLMAERRRRKRLNDRLSMLRSIVPKISKMDRTSILGDTIDYMKELLEKINSLQQEIEADPTHLDTMDIFKDEKPNEILVRNTPKFEVERRDKDTRVEICCSGKPGLLMSTVTTLEALGLEIQQCVISCFNDFSVQASCSEDAEHRTLITSEEIKQALFRNAGYGGRCL